MASEKDILIVTPSKLRGFRVGESVTERVELDWTPEKLPQALATARAALGKRIRLILGDSFTYVSSVPLAETASPEEERGTAGESFQLLMPEKLAETSWDYRAFEMPAEKSIQPRRYAEIIALTGSCARTIIPAIKEAGFRIEAVEPESISLARLLQNEDTCIMILYKSDSSFLIAGAFRGHILASFSAIPELTDAVFLETKRFLEYRFSCEVRSLHAIGSFSANDFARIKPETFDQNHIIVSTHEGSAAAGAALKDDFEGADSAILSLDLSMLATSSPDKENQIENELISTSEDDLTSEKTSGSSERFRLHFLTERSEKQNTQKKSTWSSEKKRTLILAGIFITVLLAGVSTIVVMLKNRSELSMPPADNKNRKEQEGLSNTTSPTETTENTSDTSSVDSTDDSEKEIADATTDTQEPNWNRQSFRIAIENGSGVAGAAAELKETLSAQDFVIVSIGNTESTTPTITATSNIPEEFLEELKTILPESNWNIKREDTSKLSDADIIVTLGIKP